MRKFRNLNEDELTTFLRYFTRNGYRVEIHRGVDFEEKLGGFISLCEGYDLFVLGGNEDDETE